MQAARTVRNLLPLLFIAASAVTGAQQPAFPPSPEMVAAAESAEMCRYGYSCATRNLWRMETFELTPRAGGAPYVIQISLPAGEAPPSGYPVVYLLDAGVAFNTLADIAHYQELFFVPTVAVGIRYRDPFEVDRRDDFVPPLADAFRAFLVQEVRAEVAKRAKIDPSRQALFGHSLSALFTLQVLFAQPEAFDTYVVADPSLHMGGYRIIQRWPELKQTKFPSAPRRVLVAKPGLPEGPETARGMQRIQKAKAAQPQTPAPAPPPPPASPPPDTTQYRTSLPDFVKMLQSLEGLDVTYVEFEGETHQSMVPAYLGRGMRWSLMGWDPL